MADEGRGGCVVAWTLGHLVETVNVHKFNVRVRHIEPWADWAKGTKVEAAATDADETMPAIAKGPGDELLLAYELIAADKPPVIAVRAVTIKR